MAFVVAVVVVAVVVGMESFSPRTGSQNCPPVLNNINILKTVYLFSQIAFWHLKGLHLNSFTESHGHGTGNEVKRRRR